MSDTDGNRGGLVPLAQGDLAESPPEEMRRVILFSACGEWLALPIGFVGEVQPLDRITRVPTAPREVLGILNLRGRVLTLFNLAECLRVPDTAEPCSHVVVLDMGDPELRIGLAVERIGGVRRIPVSAVEPPPPRGAVPGCLEGVFEADGQVIGLLDLSRLFARFLPEWGVTLEMRGASEPQSA